MEDRAQVRAHPRRVTSGGDGDPQRGQAGCRDGWWGKEDRESSSPPRRGLSRPLNKETGRETMLAPGGKEPQVQRPLDLSSAGLSRTVRHGVHGARTLSSSPLPVASRGLSLVFVITPPDRTAPGWGGEGGVGSPQQGRARAGVVPPASPPGLRLSCSQITAA